MEEVLILVLVEDGLRDLIDPKSFRVYLRLNPCSCGGWSQREAGDSVKVSSIEVLILVLVEDGLRDWGFLDKDAEYWGLNPCSCGGWSQSLKKVKSIEVRYSEVLILVLVEDGLRGYSSLYSWL